MGVFQVIANEGSRMYLDLIIKHLDSIRDNDHNYWNSITDIIINCPIGGKIYYITCPPNTKTINLTMSNYLDSESEIEIWFDSSNSSNIPEIDTGCTNVKLYWCGEEIIHNYDCEPDCEPDCESDCESDE